MSQRLARFLEYPLEAFAAWLALCKGVPAMLARHASINAAENGYPDAMLVVWGTALTSAGLIVLAGMVFHRLEAEVLGFEILTLATVLNVFAVVVEYQWNRPAYTALYLGFIAACAVKVAALHTTRERLNRLTRVAEDAAGLTDRNSLGKPPDEP